MKKAIEKMGFYFDMAGANYWESEKAKCVFIPLVESCRLDKLADKELSIYKKTSYYYGTNDDDEEEEPLFYEFYISLVQRPEDDDWTLEEAIFFDIYSELSSRSWSDNIWIDKEECELLTSVLNAECIKTLHKTYTEFADEVFKTYHRPVTAK